MACDGYEHGVCVIAVRNMRKYAIRQGARGVVYKVNTTSHTIDVNFDSIGKIESLDPHSFLIEENVERLAKEDKLRMTVDMVAAYLSNNQVATSQISEVLQSVFTSLSDIEAGSAASRHEAQRLAVPVRRSVTPDYIVCLEDGKRLKMLKRHLQTVYGMTPEEYRAKWGLPADYPMVAPRYAQQRSEFAKKIGLGRAEQRLSNRKRSG